MISTVSSGTSVVGSSVIGLAVLPSTAMNGHRIRVCQE